MAIDLSLTEEQQLIQDSVRSFVDERVLPVAVQNDMDHKLDMSLIDGMRELGILGAPIPTEWGGAGLDFIAEALICEEIERGEAAELITSLAWRGISGFPLTHPPQDDDSPAP